jgi:hypothetical protein
MLALQRVVSNTVEKRLLNARGKPNFNVYYYVVNAQGDYAGVSLYELSEKGEPTRFAVCTEDGSATLRAEPMFAGRPTD